MTTAQQDGTSTRLPAVWTVSYRWCPGERNPGHHRDHDGRQGAGVDPLLRGLGRQDQDLLLVLGRERGAADGS
jgi:hypothetical protein